jgi:glycosidase
VSSDRCAQELGGAPFAINPAKADDELRALVDAAHQAGLYVIFDIVLDHVGDDFAYSGSSTALFAGVRLPDQWRHDKGFPQPLWTDVATIPSPPLDAVVWPW